MIKLSNICKIYGEEKNTVYALRNVSLEVQEGEFISIIGHSGSGKSTLMNILGCLDTASSGEYLLMGDCVEKMSSNERAVLRNRYIGFIFQGFNLSGKLTALENVELPLVFRGIEPKLRHEMASEALKKVGLSARMQHKPFELSGGQQQRVAIARALAYKPPLILADEPTGNLDTKSSESVLELLRALHDDGHTIILITHDMTIAAMGQRTFSITDGCLT